MNLPKQQRLEAQEHERLSMLVLLWCLDAFGGAECASLTKGDLSFLWRADLGLVSEAIADTREWMATTPLPRPMGFHFFADLYVRKVAAAQLIESTTIRSAA